MEEEINIEKLQKDLEDSKVKVEEYLNGWKRERADFLNYKKDEMERIGQLVKYANEEIILKILPILDNLILATQHIKDDGLSQIIKQIEDFLKREGVEAIETVGKDFDPNLMEAVGEVPASAQESSGVAKEEVQRGYIMYGKLIRPAKVKITK